ncbi:MULTISPECIES: DMT family transporter [Neorhizobium]|uniref:DMT family transporter n=1 Tax=Neorhizobium TaxID=1525371 RepID=UPI000CF96310|nr:MULTISPECIES: DMT family transporter [Neorhizobium]
MTGELLALASSVAYALGSVAIVISARDTNARASVLLSVLFTAGLSLLAWLFLGASVSDWLTAEVVSAVFYFSVAGLLATAIGRLTLHKSLEHLGVVRASTVRRLTPFFSVLLAWILLGETLSGTGIGGMVLIGFTVLILVGHSWLQPTSPEGQPKPGGATLGYAFGLACALSYALSYIVRKSGIQLINDPYLGSLIGAIAALLFYCSMSLFSPSYRTVLKAPWRSHSRWSAVGAGCVALGQIIQFAALSHIPAARVALINVSEVVIASFLAVHVLKIERRPVTTVQAVAAFATVGVLLVVLE